MRSRIKISTALLILIASIFYFSFTSAEIEIKGIVTDENKAPLIGVSIVEKGSSNGTVTDVDGKFALKLRSSKPKIVVSYLGYETQTIKIGKKLDLTVQLMPSRQELEEVVVMGYAKNRRRSEDNSYAVINSAAAPSNTMIYGDREAKAYDFFKDNSFKSVQKEALSTLSIDVDRAAYSNVRSYLNKGQMPPADAVRIEEMINYFNYRYDVSNQDKDRPFQTIKTLTNCPWNKDHQLLHVSLNSKSMERKNIPATNFVFLIDVSGSMNSANKLPLLKSSFKLLVNQLSDQDKVAIVVYAGAAGCVLESTPGSDKTKILDALDKLEAGGSTAGAAGIEQAYKIAKANFIEEGNNRVILATDGDFNVGVNDDDKLIRLIEDKRETGIYLSVLGFGDGNYMDSKMQKIADHGNGNHGFIDNMQEAKKMMMDEFGSTMYTVANDVKIQIEFNPAVVSSYRTIGYENRMLEAEDFNDDTKDAGEMGAGHVVTVIYEIIPVGSKSSYNKSIDDLKYQQNDAVRSASKEEMATIKYRYKKPGNSKSVKSEEIILNKESKWENIDEDIKWSMAVAEFGLLLRDSPYKSDATYKHILSTTKSIVDKGSDVYKAEFVNLVEIANALDQG